MFSNSTTFATYADIRMAVEDAAKSGEKGELSLFGNIEVTADVTIPDYVDVLIAPDTKITLAKGCKLIATIPSREVLISKLLGSIKSPISNLARVIKQIAEKQAEA